MMKKSRIQYLGNSGEKWIAVCIPVHNGEGDTRHYEFRAEKVDGLLEISEKWSALLLENEKQIPVNLPLAELQRRFHARGNTASQLDLTSVTGMPYTAEVKDSDLQAAFTATLPNPPKNMQDIPENPNFKITLFAHHRLDENPTAKYCPLTTVWSNVSYVKKSGIAKNTTCLDLHSPVAVHSINERTKWWFDMDPHDFLAAVNEAMINGTSHLDLRDETRKRSTSRPAPGRGR